MLLVFWTEDSLHLFLATPVSDSDGCYGLHCCAQAIVFSVSSLVPCGFSTRRGAFLCIHTSVLFSPTLWFLPVQRYFGPWSLCITLFTIPVCDPLVYHRLQCHAYVNAFLLPLKKSPVRLEMHWAFFIYICIFV